MADNEPQVEPTPREDLEGPGSPGELSVTPLDPAEPSSAPTPEPLAAPAEQEEAIDNVVKTLGITRDEYFSDVQELIHMTHDERVNAIGMDKALAFHDLVKQHQLDDGTYNTFSENVYSTFSENVLPMAKFAAEVGMMFVPGLAGLKVAKGAVGALNAANKLGKLAKTAEVLAPVVGSAAGEAAGAAALGNDPMDAAGTSLAVDAIVGALPYGGKAAMHLWRKVPIVNPQSLKAAVDWTASGLNKGGKAAFHKLFGPDIYERILKIPPHAVEQITAMVPPGAPDEFIPTYGGAVKRLAKKGMFNIEVPGLRSIKEIGEDVTLTGSQKLKEASKQAIHYGKTRDAKLVLENFQGRLQEIYGIKPESYRKYASAAYESTGSMPGGEIGETISWLSKKSKDLAISSPERVSTLGDLIHDVRNQTRGILDIDTLSRNTQEGNLLSDMLERKVNAMRRFQLKDAEYQDLKNSYEYLQGEFSSKVKNNPGWSGLGRFDLSDAQHADTAREIIRGQGTGVKGYRQADKFDFHLKRYSDLVDKADNAPLDFADIYKRRELMDVNYVKPDINGQLDEQMESAINNVTRLFEENYARRLDPELGDTFKSLKQETHDILTLFPYVSNVAGLGEQAYKIPWMLSFGPKAQVARMVSGVARSTSVDIFRANVGESAEAVVEILKNTPTWVKEGIPENVAQRFKWSVDKGRMVIDSGMDISKALADKETLVAQMLTVGVSSYINAAANQSSPEELQQILSPENVEMIASDYARYLQSVKYAIDSKDPEALAESLEQVRMLSPDSIEFGETGYNEINVKGEKRVFSEEAKQDIAKRTILSNVDTLKKAKIMNDIARNGKVNELPKSLYKRPEDTSNELGIE